VLSFGRAIGHDELRGTGVTITTLCPGPTTSEFAEVANMQGAALFEGPVPVMTAAEVARQGYAALKAGRPQIVNHSDHAFHADGDLVDDCRSISIAPEETAATTEPQQSSLCCMIIDTEDRVLSCGLRRSKASSASRI
jgi:NAD(P)-dependent dehydrogenase (short-subunit alcohol dehydrogenase family)